MLSITKTFEFAYAHLLPKHKGKCINLHGHLGILEIEITNSPENFTCDYEGMIMDFGDLKHIVYNSVLNKLDHAYLNDIISVPTAENIVAWVKGRLVSYFGKGLVRIRVYETPTSYAEWRK